MKIPTVRIDDYSNHASDDETDSHPVQAISHEPIPLPPPPHLTNKVVEESKVDEANKKAKINVAPEHSVNIDLVLAERTTKEFVPVAKNSEELIGVLDDAERRVAQLRETAMQLEQEKEILLEILESVTPHAEYLKLEQDDKDDMSLTSERILKRLQAVNVVVNTPRNEDQTRALQDVTQLIEFQVAKMHEDLEATKEVTD